MTDRDEALALARRMDALAISERIGDDQRIQQMQRYMLGAAATIRALLDAQGWQPIETAPKDGTNILAYPEDEWPASIHWVEYALDIREEVGADGFWSYSDELLANIVGELWPTHWMPLPAPPAPEGQDMEASI